MRVNPKLNKKIDPRLQKTMSEATENGQEIIRVIMQLKAQRKSTAQKQLDPHDFPTRIAYRTALIEQQQQHVGEQTDKILQELKSLSLTTQGGTISPVVVVQGRTRDIMKALELPDVLHASLDQYIGIFEPRRDIDTKQSEMSEQSAQQHVFISYHHKDQFWLHRLEQVLSPLLPDRVISVWSDQSIKSGQDWRNEIDEVLANAAVGVLLISPDYLASEFLSAHELPYLLRTAKRHDVTLLWVLLKPSLYHHTPLAGYLAAHDISRPLETLQPREAEQELVAIAQTILDTTSHNSKE